MGISFPLFFLCLYFSSGSSISEKPHLKANQRNEILFDQENQIPFSDSVFTDQLDTIPIVNPTPIYNYPPIPVTPTPVTPTPITPTPITPTPVTTQPIITPTTPVTTQPIITPTTPVPPTPVSYGGSGSWCIASQAASDTALQVAIDYACGFGGANCLAIQPGASCYNPNTLRDHASYAFNDYYQKNPVATSCLFGGTAQLTTIDPSSGSCRFPSSRPLTSVPTPTNPTPAVQTPVIFSPTIPNTPTYDTPIGSSIYGSGPTGTPSSALYVSYSRLLLFLTMSLTVLIVASTYQ